MGLQIGSPFFMDQIIFSTQSGNKYLCDILAGIIVPIGTQNDLQHDNDQEPNALREVFCDTYRLCPPRIDGQDVLKCIATLPQVVFEMTSRCNLSCKYCCYGEGYTTFSGRKSGSINPEIALRVLDYLSQIFNRYNVDNTEPFVISFYGGEPLLEFKTIKRIVEYAKSKKFANREVKFSMTTNGLLLNKHIDFLAENNFHLLVSLDGNIQHNKYRVDKNGNMAFDTVFNNLMYIKSCYPKYFKSINYNSVFTNISSFDEIIDFFRNKLGKTPTISLLHEPDKDASEYEMIKEMMKNLDVSDDRALLDDIFTELPINKLVATILLNLVRNTYYSESELASASSKARYNTGTCMPFSKRMFISHTGDICVCEKISRTNNFGKVNTDTRGVKINAEEIARKFNEDIASTLPLCSKCYMQKCCNQCIYQFKGGECPSFKSKEDFAKLLSKAFTYLEQHPSVVEKVRTNFIIK